MNIDSLDKVIGTYLAAVCSKAFTYKDALYEPRPLEVSPLIFRGYTCPEQCGGCCTRFSLDYLPFERRPLFAHIEQREVVVNGLHYSVYSDMQRDHDDHYCRNLKKSTGRCGVHGKHPFSCDFELMRFLMSQQGEPNRLMTKLYGRGWNMLRIDGERGALCEMLPPTRQWVLDVLRKLTRLEKWATYFDIATKLPKIITWVESGPHPSSLWVP